MYLPKALQNCVASTGGFVGPQGRGFCHTSLGCFPEILLCGSLCRVSLPLPSALCPCLSLHCSVFLTSPPCLSGHTSASPCL